MICTQCGFVKKDVSPTVEQAEAGIVEPDHVCSDLLSEKGLDPCDMHHKINEIIAALKAADPTFSVEKMDD